MLFLMKKTLFPGDIDTFLRTQTITEKEQVIFGCKSFGNHGKYS